MDIMGFKEMVRKTDFLELQKRFNDLSDRWKNRTKPLKIGNHLKSFQFSDSIILTTDACTDQCLNLITKAGIIIMQEAMQRGFAINGALSEGLFSFDDKKQIFFGQALIDAYLLQTSLFYYGIVIHPTIENMVANTTKAKGLFTKGSVPLKGGFASHYYVNWGLIDKKNSIIKEVPKELFDELDKLELETTGNPRIYIENTRRILREKKC